jgi:MFS transporter, Spinster family, sphingosine-1-phosphate transporter
MMPVRLQVPRAAWIAVGLLWVVGLLNYLDRLVITAMREPIVASVPMTEAQFGLLTSIFLWVYGFFSPVCGFIGDRVSRKWVIFFSLVIWSVVTWVTGHAQTFEQLFWARAVMGISEACYLPAALALIADFHRGPTRSFATAVHGTGIFAGGAIGGIGGYLAETIGWRGGFTLLGAIGVGYALVLLVFLRDAPPPEAENTTAATPGARPQVQISQAVRALFTVPAFWTLLAINSLVGIADWTIYGWLPTYLREHFQLSQGKAGLTATGVLQATSFVGIMVGGVLSDAWSRRNTRARMLVPSTAYLVATPGLLLLALSGALLPALCGLALYGIARGCFDANRMPIVRQLVDERYSATAYGCLNFIGCLTGGLMTYAGGGLRDAGLSLSIAFLVCAGAIGLTSALCFTLRPKAPLPAEPTPPVQAQGSVK